MWKLTGLNKGSGPLFTPKDIDGYYSGKTTHVEAELCRDPNCSVRHIFPIDVVFSVRNLSQEQRKNTEEMHAD
ncbi:hypothetical protein AAVH_26433 [Aphelenchoides avenae]|nr:hypothetical protein AAVH_26433 [Aphelenchus avenae]